MDCLISTTVSYSHIPILEILSHLKNMLSKCIKIIWRGVTLILPQPPYPTCISLAAMHGVSRIMAPECMTRNVGSICQVQNFLSVKALSGLNFFPKLLKIARKLFQNNQIFPPDFGRSVLEGGWVGQTKSDLFLTLPYNFLSATFLI